MWADVSGEGYSRREAATSHIGDQESWDVGVPSYGQKRAYSTEKRSDGGVVGLTRKAAARQLVHWRIADLRESCGEAAGLLEDRRSVRYRKNVSQNPHWSVGLNEMWWMNEEGWFWKTISNCVICNLYFVPGSYLYKEEKTNTKCLFFVWESQKRKWACKLLNN